ncbi:MAG: LptA/OstA family protein [Pseudomonadota bacterium]
MRRAPIGWAMGAVLALAAPVAAQTNTPFGSFEHDSSQPIEVTANALAVNQTDQTATFSGNVVAGQGTLRLTADEVLIEYSAEGGSETGAIRRLMADGNVFLSNGSEQSRGDRAEYDVARGAIFMEGNVILTQGQNALSCDRLDIDLNAGTGNCTGRVETIFVPTAGAEDN